MSPMRRSRAVVGPVPAEPVAAQIRTAPHVADIVHYVSYGTPGGEYGKECRAAIVTEVAALLPEQPNDGTTAGLCVLNPTGQFFNRGVPYDSGIYSGGEQTGLPAPLVTCDDLEFAGGTWHWAAG